MKLIDEHILQQVRDRFHHVDECPYQGPRAFFENAGGSLTLKSVVECAARLSAIPDNQGRDNPASKALVALIEQGRRDIKTFLGVEHGQVIIGEGGTELLFRLVRAAVLGSPEGGEVVGSTLEHPATVSACRRWSKIAGKQYIAVAHDTQSATLSADAYACVVTPQTRVVTIIQASPVAGTGVDVAAIVEVVRRVAPECLIIVDGIQHAAHGQVCVADYDIDAFAVSAYKVFSKHNYGVAWLSERLAALPHDHLDGTPLTQWELGTRDSAAYATFSAVVDYLEWLGAHYTDAPERRARILMAGQAMAAHEAQLVDLSINGDEQTPGLRAWSDIHIVGGADNAAREGLVSFYSKTYSAAQIVAFLNENGVRTHVRKADYFSANILTPLGQDSCVRVSFGHYNTTAEVRKFLDLICTLHGS